MIVIMRGPTGSGKSLIVNTLIGKNKLWEEHPDCIKQTPKWQYIKALKDELVSDTPIPVVSADHHFIDENGNYNFKPMELSTAHNKCLAKFIELITERKDRHIIVDNTNCSIAEVAAYIAIANALENPVRIITLYASPETAASRGTHGAPDKNIIGQCHALQKSLQDWPLWWKQEVFLVD